MSGSQDSYAYDVPSTYINFSSLHDDDVHDADTWFDQVADAGNIPTSQAKIIEQNTHVNAKSSSIRPSLKVDENSSILLKEVKKTPMNSQGTISSSVKKDTPGPGANRRLSKRLSSQQKKKQLAKIRAERHKVVASQPEERPPLKKQKLSTSKGKLDEASLNKGASTSGAGRCSQRQKARLAVPITPTVLKRKNTTVKPKNSEEQELEKVQQLQQELVERLRKNEESLKTAIAGVVQPVKKLVTQVTKPVDFHFRTDERIKKPEEQSGDQYKEVDFPAALRRHPPSPVQMPKGGHTVPKPFNLSQGNKRKHEESSNTVQFVSTAEQVYSFSKLTPARYHLRSRQKEMEGPSPVKPIKQRLTNPKTPLLQTKQRLRPVTCKSSAAIEEEELQKLQQYKFKALELDTRILEGGPLFLKKPPVKEPTKAIGFNLEIEKRIQQREKKDEQEEHFTFQSKPCPSKILSDVVGVPEKKNLPITVPKSPAFALRNRVRVQSWSEKEEEEEVAVIKAIPMPHYGLPFKPKLVEQKQVETCPFSFSDRDKVRQQQKERKLEEQRKAEVPKFKAQPLPQFEQIHLPEKKVKMQTHQEPFQLQIDQRGASKLQRWKQQVEEELKQQKEMTTFKARPNTVTNKEPFIPKKETKSLTVQDAFELATEKRAKERQEFERRLADVEAQKSLLEEERRRAEEEQEQEEVNRLRHELVHKAKPIRKYKPVEVKASDAPLTFPKSPNFSDRFRI